MKKLSLNIKLFYGLGMASRGIKDGLFQLFLFFYFSQVLGLAPELAGLSSLVALGFDAISDPLVGLISDKWQSKKWGRRHPFLFVSALPLGVFTWLLFAPPEGLEQTGLFWWLTIFAILVRFALTLFNVPYISLGAELSSDYKERTLITAIRLMFATLFPVIVMIVGYVYYFVPTEEYSNGLLNKGAYPTFALLCGVLMVIIIVTSAWGTRKAIPNLPQPSAYQNQLTSRQLLSSLSAAFKMTSFRSLVIFNMLLYIGLGVGIIFSPYFGPYYFGFAAQEMAVLPISSAIGGFLSLIIAPSLGDKLGKKGTTLWSALIAGLFFALPYNLRMLGFFPENGTSSILPIYVVTLIIAYTALVMALSLVASMMADVVDEFELKTGNRQEGLFFSMMSFAYKMTTGVGTFIAGLLLAWIQFPKQADVADVAQSAIDGLGLVGGPIVLSFFVLSVFFIIPYPITKARFQEIRGRLDEKSNKKYDAEI
ncbi:MAG: GPH family glycoside/pentoside/hexuronide:cation symporter [Saprospiraceae bacterium]|jgi:GPH family glycoside/pentoside/hexuronide:cation symporter